MWGRAGAWRQLRLVQELGALQLLPQNTRRVLAMHAALEDALSLRPAWRRSRHSIVRAIAESKAPRWERATGTLVTEITTSRGGFRAITPMSPEDAWFAELLATEFADSWGAEDGPLGRAARSFYALLALSDSVVERTGLPRHAPLPAGSMLPDLALHRLDRAGMNALRRSITFELDDPDFTEPLLPFMRTSGSPDSATAEVRPLIHVGKRLVVGAPHGLLGAAWRHLRDTAVATGHVEAFTTAFSNGVLGSVADSLARLGLLLIADPPRDDDPEFDRLELLVRCDVDKAIHLLAIFDDGEGAEGTGPASSREAHVRALRRRLAVVAETLFTGGSAPNELLHLVVTQDAKSSPPPVLPKDGLCGAISLNAWELHAIAVAPRDPDVLTLRNLVHARPTLRSSRSADQDDNGVLEEFAFLESVQRIQGPWELPQGAVLEAFASALDRRTALLRDRHAAPSPLGGYRAVVLRMEPGHEPHVYVPDVPAVHRPPWVMFASYGLHVWCVPAEPETTLTDWEPAEALMNLIPFWLGQLREPLAATLKSIASRTPMVTMRMSAPSPRHFAPPAPRGAPLWSMTANLAEATVDIALHPAIWDALSGDVPHAEHGLALDAIRKLAAMGGAELPPELVHELVSVMAGRRNLAQVSVPDRTLIPTGVPHRTVDEWARASVRRLVGTGLGMRRPQEQFVPTADVVNDAVGRAFARLEHLGSTLVPHGLLEQLISFNEEHLHRQARMSMDLPLAGLSGDVDKALDLTEERHQGLFSDGVARRFLIEYFAARPPSGVRPFSFSVYGELLATATLIVEWGVISDLLAHGLASARALGTADGGLWIYPADYSDAMWSFRRGALQDAATDAGWIFERAEESDENEIAQERSADLDAAFGDETQWTLTEHNQAFQELLDWCDEDASFVVMDWEEAVGKLASALAWEPARADSFMRANCLSPRRAFLSPPDGLPRREVFPWRSARTMSVLRRPLLRRPLEKKAQVLFGPRQLIASWSHLLEMLTTSRYPARKSPLKTAMSALQQAEAERFNDQVADEYARVAHLYVKPRFNKIGSQRLADADGVVGDVDVLVVDPDTRTVLCVETKRLAHAFMPHQVAHMLDETFGQGGQRRSAVERHLRRIECVQDHLDRVLAQAGQEPGPEWTVQGLMVTEQELLGPHVARGPIPVRSFGALKRAIQEGRLY